MPCPETTPLPFNTAILGDDFAPVKPGDADGVETGFWVIFRGDEVILNGGENVVSLVGGELPGWIGERHGTLIGRWKGKPVRLMEVAGDAAVPAGYLVEPLLFTFFHQRLPDDLVTLAGLAQQILAWERKSRLCHRCGGDVAMIPGTWGKRCGKCGHEQFPHIHPCTIVLVQKGEEILLIHKPEWPEGFYSLPSGFCDFGESLEECARREVEEETGIMIRGLRYVASQSWPFPGQLMIGFSAEYDGGEIVVDKSELEDAAWFRRDSLPPTFSAKSLAGWMMRHAADCR